MLSYLINDSFKFKDKFLNVEILQKFGRNNIFLKGWIYFLYFCFIYMILKQYIIYFFFKNKYYGFRGQLLGSYLKEVVN